MSQTQWFISRNGQNSGPYTWNDMLMMLNNGDVQLTDYLFDESQQDWVRLLEMTAVKEHLKTQKPTAPPKPMGPPPVMTQPPKAETRDEEWFILKWDHRHGPFAVKDLIRMLQEKAIFEFDFAWKKGMETWCRIAEITHFSKENIRHMIQELDDARRKAIFMNRATPRISMQGSLVIHNHTHVWKGKGSELSEGGAGVVMYNSLLLPGQRIYMHFRPIQLLQPFNAFCEIVSKNYTKGITDRSAPVQYAVKFLDVDRAVREHIREFVKGGNKNAA